MQILIVEDDKRISEFLSKGLEENGHSVTLCQSAEEVIEQYTLIKWDVIICDVMLPIMDGKQLVQYLRYKKMAAPILMLSALGEVEDKVSALNVGADDYLTKPFHFDELLSRLYALNRRFNQQLTPKKENVLELGTLIINYDTFEVNCEGNQLGLSLKEFKLLTYLAENCNKALSRTQILNAVWGIQFINQTNIVDVYISYLRGKALLLKKSIQTIKGVGYMYKNTQYEA